MLCLFGRSNQPSFAKLELTRQILQTTGASSIRDIQSIQTLWSGYGEIKRVYLESGKYSSVIVKHIQLPDVSRHPKGWNTDLSHQRKLHSYQVERSWYQGLSGQTDSNCRVPESYHVVEEDAELLIIMEDLDAQGYEIRMHHDEVTLAIAKTCLTWLAHFHAKFMGIVDDHLWEIGTYWHLDTRPDEWKRMQNQQLKEHAKAIDNRLNSARFKTLVHGDAKLANFCFSEGGEVAAVDFQYIGGGCGMKDVAYFISSCFHEDECEEYEKELLDFYFNQLEISLDKSFDFQSLKEEWGSLYRYAWADFYRFLDGWSPGHWKMHRYSEKIANQVIEELAVQ